MVSSDLNLKTIVRVGITARIGTAVGNELRAFVFDQLENRRRRTQGLPEKEKRVYLQTIDENAVLTNTLLALTLALGAERRRPLRAFVIGAVLTALVGDRFDRALSSTFEQAGVVM